MLKLHTRKINWWSSHRIFECYNYGELEYSEEDFATGFVVRLYLLFEILWFFPLHRRVFHVRFGVLVWLCLCGAC